MSLLITGCGGVATTGYTDACINKVGGNQEVIYYQTFGAHSGQSINASNIITAITMSGTAKLQPLVTGKNGVIWKSSPVIDAEAGTLVYKQTATAKLLGITTQLLNILATIAAQGVVLYVYRRSGEWFQLGGGYINSGIPVGGGLYLSSDTVVDPSTKSTEYAGVTLSWEGEEFYNVREVTTAAMNAVIA